jgi:pyridoxal phosphate enzyme (YggS family)
MVGSGVADRLAGLRARIAAAAARSGRDAGSVTLVGAAKRQEPERLLEAWTAGLTVFGENHVQEAEAHRLLLPAADLHLIGPLQSNKARRAVELCSTVHSVDRLKIAHLLDREAGARGQRLAVFLEVNLGGEDTKAGFAPDGLAAAVAPVAELANLEVLGLMAIPPPGPDAEASRPHFRRLAVLARSLSERPEWHGRFAGQLSMGMSDDFEVAVEEGAHFVRVGTALFGPRVRP